MRRPLWPGLLALVAIGATGCDTDQPAQGGTQNAMLTVRAPAATVKSYFTWALQEDSDGIPGPDDINGDGTVDALDDTLWCQDALQNVSPSSVPWTYSLKVNLLREGEVTPLQLSSAAALADGFNRADYDNPVPEPTHTQPQGDVTITHPAGQCSDKPIKCNPNSSINVCGKNAAGACVGLGGTMMRTFTFPAGTRRTLSAANLRLLEASGNVISDNCSGGAGAGCAGAPVTQPPLGECPGDPVGTAAIDPDNPLATGSDFSFQMERGDTVIVEARRSNVTPGGGTTIQFLAPPSLSALFSVEGVPLQASEVVGSLESTDAASPNISFSYTSQ